MQTLQRYLAIEEPGNLEQKQIRNSKKKHEEIFPTHGTKKAQLLLKDENGIN